MKLFRYMACGLLVAGSLTVFTACEDDNNLGEAPRLFSPVVNVTTNANAIECKWNGIQGATSYILTLQRELTTTDDSGAALAEDVRKVTVDVDPTGVSHFSPYTFEDLDWDERYRVAIQAVGTDKESNVYTCEFVSVTYPTKVKAVTDIVDTGVKLEWNQEEGETVDLTYVNVFVRNDDGTTTPYNPSVETATVSREDADETPDYYYTLTDEDRANGYIELYGLEDATPYRVIFYSNEGDYRGRRDFKTQTAEVYPDPTLVHDLRGLDDAVADTIMCTDFFDTLPEGAIVILKGGYKYPTKGTPKITKSVTIKTGMSLSGKATIATAGMATSGDIANVTFENVKLTCDDGADLTSNFGGRYLFNHSNLGVIGNLTLENVDVKYMRGVIRTRKEGQRYDNITINNCTLDSIGGYKVIHLDTKDTSIGNVTITNSTFSNVEGIIRANNRDNTQIDNVLVDNCTFAYCSNNAELFMFKRDGCNVNLKFNMNNCIVGGNFNGKTGQGFSCNDGATAGFSRVYVTSDFNWTLTDTGEIKAPFGAFETLTETTDQIWENPKALDFTIKNPQSVCNEIGDPRWHI